MWFYAGALSLFTTFALDKTHVFLSRADSTVYVPHIVTRRFYPL